MAEPLPFPDTTAPTGRGLVLRATIPHQQPSGLDPSYRAMVRAITLSRNGFGLSQEPRDVLGSPQAPMMGQLEQDTSPAWAKSRSSIGAAFQSGPWTVAVEYQQGKNRQPFIDRGYFRSSGKVFAGLQYQFDKSTSVYMGVSSSFSAGLRWVGKEGDEAALTFAGSPNGEMRKLFSGSSPENLRNVITLTYRIPLGPW
ncbi:MAG: hypothetical protein IPJ68_01205 [Candidatus Moraniibacteriota bacterium]|nr:MAG: hypothetical protein IPJ68_01205 [Candidatus Moranbacteria bacterium]